MVFVRLLDSEPDEVAARIGSLKRGKDKSGRSNVEIGAGIVPQSRSP